LGVVGGGVDPGSKLNRRSSIVDLPRMVRDDHRRRASTWMLLL
jgi:hypothetical protein